MSCGIYKVTNILNNKIYIGQSTNIEKRWSHHKANYDNKNEKSYNFKFYTAIREHGVENFKIEIIEFCEKNELNLKEEYWIKKYDSVNSGYNTTLGGKGAKYINEEEVIEWFVDNGRNVTNTAEHFGINRTTASHIIKKHNIDNYTKISQEEELDIIKDYINSKSLSYLENKYHRDRKRISEVLNKHHIQKRENTMETTHKKISVYDIKNNVLLFDNTTIYQFMDYLKENEYEKISLSTIHNAIYNKHIYKKQFKIQEVV